LRPTPETEKIQPVEPVSEERLEVTVEDMERAFWESDLGRLKKRLFEANKPFTTCLDALVHRFHRTDHL